MLSHLKILFAFQFKINRYPRADGATNGEKKNQDMFTSWKPVQCHIPNFTFHKQILGSEGTNGKPLW